MKPTTNAPTQPYTSGGKIITKSPIRDHQDGSVSTVRKK